MGNCLCRPDLHSKINSKPGLLPASERVFGKDFCHVETNSVAGQVSTAHFAASPTKNTYSISHQFSEDTVLIGLVEGVGPEARSAALTAAFVSNHLLPTFQDMCTHYGPVLDNSEEILRATLQSLHRKCLASPTLPRRSKDCTFGASATIALVNLSTHKATVANVGQSRCLIAGVSGSFNSKRPHHTWASALHTTENPKERIHADRHKSALIPLSTTRKVNRNNTGGSTAAHPKVFLTRALGIATNSNTGGSSITEKTSALRVTTARPASFKNKFDVEVEVNTFQLTPTEGQLIIGSAGFWEVVAPPAATLQAHLFSNFQEAQKSVVEAALKDGVPLPSPAERSSFLAEHLINFALSTTAARLETSASHLFQETINKNSKLGINIEDLKSLPFEAVVDTEESLTSQGECDTTNGSDDGNSSASLVKNEEEEKQVLVRKDVFGDLACVAISFQWPTTGHQAMFQPPPPRLFHPTTAVHGTTHRQALSTFNFQDSTSSDLDLAPLARFRWIQLRSLVVDYHRLHRREVLQRWQETVHGIMKKAQQRAKAVAYQVENESGIAVNVSPLMKLSAKDGRELPSSAFNVRASNF